MRSWLGPAPHDHELHDGSAGRRGDNACENGAGSITGATPGAFIRAIRAEHSENPVEHIRRRIYDGPDEVHRMLVAREVLDNFEQNAPWM